MAPVGDVDDSTFPCSSGHHGRLHPFPTRAPPILTLFGPDGAVVAGGGDFDTRLHLVTLPADGAYRPQVRPMGVNVDFRLDDAGSYSFAVWARHRNPTPVPIAFGQNLPAQVATHAD